ncbi:pepsin-like aspartyl protease, partial [Acinetobacter baumannii]|uniref:pepsin-like aspartyl protease n=1 Tax=Acinetobacter baumannii TaxID=470 RepID=UPI0011136FBA
MSDVPLQPGSKVGAGNYILTAGFGTPAKNLFLIIDTGSDVTWIQCNPCSDCYSQVDPIFNPHQSFLYKLFPCLSAVCTQLATAEGNSN